jgi:hypothetical protein
MLQLAEGTSFKGVLDHSLIASRSLLRGSFDDIEVFYKLIMTHIFILSEIKGQ